MVVLHNLSDIHMELSSLVMLAVRLRLCKATAHSHKQNPSSDRTLHVMPSGLAVSYMLASNYGRV